jgi:hypothetical protein
MPTLHLTAHERELFDALTPALREGYEIVEESLRFEDTPERQKLRLESLHLTSPALKAMGDKLSGEMSLDEMAAVFDSFNADKMTDSDLGQLFFGVGPGVMSFYVREYLKAVKDDEDLMNIVALTQLRHIVLESLNQAFSA